MCRKAGSAGSVTLDCKGACFTPTIRQVLAPGLVGGPGAHHQLLGLHGRHGLQLVGGQSTLSAGVSRVFHCIQFCAAAKFVYN
jgi:hypothetical protein